MNHQQEREYLIKYLLKENKRYRGMELPGTDREQRDLLRALMNVRAPGEISSEFLRIQDDYLGEELRLRGVVSEDEWEDCGENIFLWQGDITRLATDAIVNAANSQMLGCFIPMHTCIDNCIHTFAGVQLRAECSRQMNQLRIKYGRDYEQPTAVPMLTDAYNLPAKKIIHIVGPIVQYELKPELEKDLADCYLNTLDMCLNKDLKSVAFCCISTGVFRFPNKRAAEIAVQTVNDWMKKHPGSMERVIFDVFKDEDKKYYEELIR